MSTAATRTLPSAGKWKTPIGKKSFEERVRKGAHHASELFQYDRARRNWFQALGRLGLEGQDVSFSHPRRADVEASAKAIYFENNQQDMDIDWVRSERDLLRHYDPS